MTDFTAWKYKTPYSQPGSTDGDKTNYPVPITIPYQSFMRSDFGDIRFALQDGTELSYSLEDYTASSSADFLVQFPSLPASPTTTTILIYAGNPVVTTTSNPNVLCDLYDDFKGSSLDTTKWNVVGSPTISVANGELTISRIPSSNWSFHGITSKNYQFNNNNGTEKIIVKFKRSNVLQSASSNIASRYFSKGKIDDLSQQGTTVLVLQTDDRDGGGGFYGVPFTKSFVTGTYYTLQMSQNNGLLTAILNTETETSSNAIFTDAAPVALGLIEWQSYSATHDLIIDYIKILQTTPNPPTAGELGGWVLTDVNLGAFDEAFGLAKLNQNMVLNSITPAEAFGDPKIDFDLISISILPDGSKSEESFGTPFIINKGLPTLILYPNGTPSGEIFGNPKFNRFIKAVSVSSREDFGLTNVNVNLIRTSNRPSFLTSHFDRLVERYGQNVTVTFRVPQLDSKGNKIKDKRGNVTFTETEIQTKAMVSPSSTSQKILDNAVQQGSEMKAKFRHSDGQYLNEDSFLTVDDDLTNSPTAHFVYEMFRPMWYRSYYQVYLRARDI